MNGSLNDLVRQTRELLRFQGELGLDGLDVPVEILSLRSSMSRPASRPASETQTSPPAAPAPGPAASLPQIAEALADCTRCKLCEKRTHIVFGVGNPNARLMFIGEAPGRDEDLQGEPFVGPAGQLLDRMIAAMTLQRSDVYIANIVKCRPPGNRDPEPNEVTACEPFLKQQIAAIRPEVIVALGRCAAQTLLGDDSAITRIRGRWREYEGIPMMPTFHPAHLLRDPAGKKPVWKDLQEVMARLGLQVPGRGT